MFYINLFLSPGAYPVTILKIYYLKSEESKMLVIIYIISLVYGFINFYQYNSGMQTLGKFIIKAFVTFTLALIFCFFQFKGFENGEIAFTVKNNFPMWFLIAYHFNLWINIEEDYLETFLENSACCMLIAIVCTFATRLIFALCF